jgi:3-isopropylmalate dehydratase small subunit
MGDVDIANTFTHGKTWFKVPPTVKITLKGTPSKTATAKDIVLKMVRELGANGLLGYAAELYGDYIDGLSLDGRVTIASMATEMGGIIMFLPPNDKVIEYFRTPSIKQIEPVFADQDAEYEKEITIDIQDLPPQISLPGHPEDVVDVSEVKDVVIDSGFIGSCTNGRLEDLESAAGILTNRKVAPGRILKIVPSTDRIWRRSLERGMVSIFKDAGALIGSAGCAGCAAGQIGQTGADEIAVSSGNRNFVGKQGKGDIYLASPATVAASLVTGYITTADSIPKEAKSPLVLPKITTKTRSGRKLKVRPFQVQGNAWVIKKDNIDTDMIYHNRYLSVTDIAEMGQYTFDNLKGYEDFARKVTVGDIVVTGKNFGCGSSRQQAVDCFRSLGVSAVIAESFGSIYERNAINSGFPILVAENITQIINNNDILAIDFLSGEIMDKTQKKTHHIKPFSPVQKEIYERGGLLQGG